MLLTISPFLLIDDNTIKASNHKLGMRCSRAPRARAPLGSSRNRSRSLARTYSDARLTDKLRSAAGRYEVLAATAKSCRGRRGQLQSHCKYASYFSGWR